MRIGGYWWTEFSYEILLWQEELGEWIKTIEIGVDRQLPRKEPYWRDTQRYTRCKVSYAFNWLLDGAGTQNQYSRLRAAFKQILRISHQHWFPSRERRNVIGFVWKLWLMNDGQLPRRGLIPPKVTPNSQLTMKCRYLKPSYLGLVAKIKSRFAT